MDTTTQAHSASPLSPLVCLDQLPTQKGSVWVVRDDLLTGGTKQRAAIPYLKELARSGHKHFVYASPFCGFAQIALAASSQSLGFPTTLFCEASPLTHQAHEFSKIAESFGAEIQLFPSLALAEEAAVQFTSCTSATYKIPLGFADPAFHTFLHHEISQQFIAIGRRLKKFPQRVWLPVGSGTLANVFSPLLPEGCELMGIDVGVLNSGDERLTGLSKLKNVRLQKAPETFCEPATLAPTIPSNLHYDAKLWRFIDEQSQPGDLWWNVAR